MRYSYTRLSVAGPRCLLGCLAVSVSLFLGLGACIPGSARTEADSSPHVSAQTQAPHPGAVTVPPGADVVEVRRDDVAEFVPAVGTLTALRTTRIGPQVTARVEEVYVDVGDVVTKDQPLVKLDTSFFSIEAAQRLAELESARVQVTLTQITLQRIEELTKGGNSTEQALDEARANHDLAKAKVELATQVLHFAEKNIAECIIRAPYDGVIAQRFVDPGEPVATTPATELLEIQDVGTLELLFTLPQRYLGAVAPGGPVSFRTSNIEGLNGQGVIDEIFPSLDETTRTIRCRVLVDNRDMRFRPGLLLQVGIVTRVAKGVLALPPAALSQTASGQAVQVYTDSGYVERPVKVGLTSLTTVEITQGLVEGDRVLVFRTGDRGADGDTP